jgi:hypothetical protein
MGSDLDFPSGSDLDFPRQFREPEKSRSDPREDSNMRIPVSLVLATALVLVFTGAAAAQGKGGPHGGNAGTAPTKASGKGGPTKTTSPPKSHANGHTKSGDATTSTAPAKKTTTATTAASGTTLTPVQQKLQQNTNLASKLQSRLPDGTDLNAAAGDFRNLGQFVAAVNVSNNLGLDFQTLKTAMTKDGKSLGQAIQAQKGTVDGATVAARAERDADTEIRSTEKSSKSPKTKTKSDGGRP